MQMLFFEHLDELRSLCYATLLTVASVGYQTAELQANILAVSAYDTQATGHALHESKNGHHCYMLSHKVYAWQHCSGLTGPGTQH